MNRKAIITSAATLTVLSLYGCAPAPDPMPFDPSKIEINTRQAAKDIPNRTLKPIDKTLDPAYSPYEMGKPSPAPSKTPTTSPALSLDPTLRISLQEAIHRAVNNNMDIRVAGYDPGINSNRVVEAEAKFDPTFFFNPLYDYRNTQANPTNFTLTEQQTEVWGVVSGIRQDLENGGSAELRYESSDYYSRSQSRFVPDQEFFSNNLVAELKQPLLRNFGTEINRARITVAQNDQKISILDYRKKLEETLFDVEQVYWQLMQAEADVGIAERLLVRSEETSDLLAKRGMQDVTLIQTSQSNSSLYNRRAILVRARSRVRDLSDQLKRLMDDPELPVSSNILVLPSTKPLETPVYFDAQDQINQALEHRLELAQQLLRLKSSSLITRVAKNNMLPALQLVQTVTANGANQNWSDTNDNMLDFDHMSYRAGVQFEIPIGNRQARAIYQRTLLQRQQTIDQYRALVDQVSLDVKVALREVQTSWDEMDATHQAVLAAAKTVDVIELRQRGQEALDPTFVQLRLDSQARLAEVERAQAQSQAAYCIAIAKLEKAKGTLLRYDNVILEEDHLDAVTRGKVLSNLPPLMKEPTTQPAE